MAIQYINTGSSANAGNGDSIRLAFTKVNNNFAEVTDRINSTTYTVDNGIFQGISVAVTATILDLVVTGTTTLTNVSITGQVTGPVVFDSTGTFANLVVLNTATINHLTVVDLSVANTSTFDDIVVNGQVLGDLNVTNSGTFASLYVANTTTLNDLNINGELHIGTYQGFDDFNIIKDDINGLNFRLRNIHADSFTQINLLDNIDGGLNFVHQNSTGDSGNFSAGQNYIYGVTPTDTLNIGKYSDINFFANVDKYYTPSLESIPSITIAAVDGKVTIAKDLYVTSSTFFLGGKAVAVTPSNGLTIDGNPITGSGSSDRLTNGLNEVVLDASGAVTYPNTALQRDTGTVLCPGNASTVVYASIPESNRHTIKLLIQVEGFEGVNIVFDTQACEMIIANSFRANALAASVYGVVHTSVAPLATFTANWNSLTGSVEVLCTTPGANSVNVRIFATEITTSD